MIESIVLIDPGFLGKYGMGKWGKSYWTTAINHGIAQISAVCKSQNINTILIDFRQLKGFEEFRNTIKSLSQGWYCVTCRTLDVKLVEEAIKIIKKEKPEAKIIIGGVHPSLCPDDFLSNKLIDYVFVGEADSTLPLLLRDPDKYPRLVKGAIPDINSIPPEDISIYDYKRSISFSLYGGIVRPPTIPVITSRGCVFNCKFCQPAEQILYGKGYRQKSPERVIKELMSLFNNYYFNSIMFYDDCLLAHKRYVAELLKNIPSIKNKKIDVMLQGRADNICALEKEMPGLKKLGLKAVIVGFESGSQRVLDFIGKRTTVEQNVRAAEILHRNDIKIVGNFMIGLPTETNSEIQETVDMADKIKSTIASCSFYSPMPGSYIYDYCVKNDLILEKDFDELSRDPKKPKIRGVDYVFATEALYKIVGSRFSNPLVKKAIGFAYKNLSRGFVRELATRFYNKVFN